MRTTPRALTEEDEHFNWLKTTVYTAIGCTVATVIIISFVVIIVFRLKMKRLRARRLAHQMERHRLRHQGEEAVQLGWLLALFLASHLGRYVTSFHNPVLSCSSWSALGTEINLGDFLPFLSAELCSLGLNYQGVVIFSLREGIKLLRSVEMLLLLPWSKGC